MPAADPRYNHKVYITTYITQANLTKDDGSSLMRYLALFAEPEYPIEAELLASPQHAHGDDYDDHIFPADIVFAIGIPRGRALPDSNRYAYGYMEEVPITVVTVEKEGITGTRALWKGVAELRNIVDNHPEGSYRTFDVMVPTTQRIGPITIHQVTCMIGYKRGLT